MDQEMGKGAPMLAARVAQAKSSAVRDLLHDARRPGMLSLAGGLPAPDLFDVDGMRMCMLAAMDETGREVLQYGPTEGEPGLRAWLAGELRRRGAAGIEDEQPLITTGSQQALELVARALLDPGDRVVVERPAYLAALQVFALAQAECVAVAGDADGLRVDALPAASAGAPLRLAYVVSNFANPSGATLSLERRLALLEWAVANRVFVLEDDPYGALRVDGREWPPLIALAGQVPGAAQWCGYVSSLSKTLAPGLRIGYAVLPDWLRGAVVRAKQAMDLHTSTLSQAIVTRYLASGRLAERMPAMLAAYRERRDALCNALAAAFGDALAFERPAGGMFVWARFTDGTDASELLPRARDEGVIFVPGGAFYDADPDRSALRLSFATLMPAQLDEAVSRLARAHRAWHADRPGARQAAGLAPNGTAREGAEQQRTATKAAAAAMGGGAPQGAAQSVRDACVAAAQTAWEDAGIRGLCTDGRWEAAIGAIRSLNPDTLPPQR